MRIDKSLKPWLINTREDSFYGSRYPLDHALYVPGPVDTRGEADDTSKLIVTDGRVAVVFKVSGESLDPDIPVLISLDILRTAMTDGRSKHLPFVQLAIELDTFGWWSTKLRARVTVERLKPAADGPYPDIFSSLPLEAHPDAKSISLDSRLLDAVSASVGGLDGVSIEVTNASSVFRLTPEGSGNGPRLIEHAWLMPRCGYHDPGNWEAPFVQLENVTLGQVTAAAANLGYALVPFQPETEDENA